MVRWQGWKSGTVCCAWALVGRKNTSWLGQHYSSPQTQSMSWSLTVSEKKNGRQGGVGGDEVRSMCVSTGSSSFLLHPFTFLHRAAFVCMYVGAYACVTSYTHKRFCILSALFILPFIWTVLFLADHWMSCPRLTCVGKQHSNLMKYVNVIINTVFPQKTQRCLTTTNDVQELD